MRREPLTPLGQHFAALAPEGPERQLLQRMMERLGHGSLEARCLACSQAAEELSLLARQVRERADKDARMWTSLGWTVGTCLALMLV